MNIEEIKKYDWEYDNSRRMTYQKVQLYYFGFYRGLRKILNFQGDAPTINRIKNGDNSEWVDKKTSEEFQLFLKEFFTGERTNKYLPKLANKIKRDFDVYLKHLKKFPRSYTTASDGDLLQYIERLHYLDKIVEAHYWITFNQFEDKLSAAVVEKLSCQGYDEVEVATVLEELSHPIKLTPLYRERISLLKIALLPDRKAGLALEKHYQEFSYMPMYDINSAPFTREHFQHELKHVKEKMTPTQIREEIAKIKNYCKQKKVKVNYKSDWKLKNLIYFYRRFSFLKEEKPYTRDKANYLIRPLYEELAKRCELSLDELLFLSDSEVKEILSKSSKLSREQIKARTRDCAYFCADGKIECIDTPEELRQIDEILRSRTDISELKGIGVTSGKISGNVSLVISNNDFKSFKSGDVLIASATRPDYLPLMKKAAAIVTNEGGMLSHAAIVSREFGIPCVVGTKTATQIFKNGDTVEVDANQGIVRKI